ncbi:MAG: BrnA antitoxin family protein [Verrucomicrobiota bacterium]
MKTEYDFSKGVRNPYVKKEKKAVTIRLENEVVGYFKSMSSETGIPYQNLINLYLRDCAEHSRKLSLIWNGKKE